MSGLAALCVGLVIVLLFANHPSVTPYHTGFAGWVVAGVFLVSVFLGAVSSRLYVLAALLFLAFVEPGVKVTNTLQFGIVSNGLLVGAGTTWAARPSANCFIFVADSRCDIWDRVYDTRSFLCRSRVFMDTRS